MLNFKSIFVELLHFKCVHHIFIHFARNILHSANIYTRIQKQKKKLIHVINIIFNLIFVIFISIQFTYSYASELKL